MTSTDSATRPLKNAFISGADRAARLQRFNSDAFNRIVASGLNIPPPELQDEFHHWSDQARLAMAGQMSEEAFTLHTRALMQSMQDKAPDLVRKATAEARRSSRIRRAASCFAKGFNILLG